MTAAGVRHSTYWAADDGGRGRSLLSRWRRSLRDD